MSSLPTKAISDINIDIVRHIPTSIPTHIISYNLTSLVFSITLSLDKKDVINVILKSIFTYILIITNNITHKNEDSNLNPHFLIY